jgi:pimeloyl-[acyl-carrier protein] methyl ester esterase
VLHVEHTVGARAGTLPIVMLHGWGMNLRVFDALRAELAGHDTWAVDLPGHGRSPWWPQAAGFEAQRDAVLAVLPPRAVLVGWSFGAKLALSIAAEHAGRVAGLVLIAATPKHLQSADWPQGMAPETLRAFRTALEQDWWQTLEDFVSLQLRGGSNAEAARRSILAALLDHGAPQPEGLRAGLALLGTVDLRAVVARITAPALLIAGANDRVTPPAAARWLAQAIPDAGLIEIPRAGHAPLVSHHAQVAAALRGLLARVESGVAA